MSRKLDIVDEAGAHSRVDVFVTERMPLLSRAFVQKLCEDGQIEINGAAVKAGHKLHEGDIVTVNYDEKQLAEDYEYVLKKLRLSHDQFQQYMRLPARSHYEFDYEKPIDERYPLLKPVKKIFRIFFPEKIAK